MPEFNVYLAENLRKYRKKAGITQEELGEKLGVTFQTVSKWENMKAVPDALFLPMIADIFECSIDDLFSYVAKAKREPMPNLIPNLSIPEELKKYVSNQIRCQLDNNGSSEKLLGIIADNIDGKFKLTDENIDRLTDAYRELYKGMIR